MPLEIEPEQQEEAASSAHQQSQQQRRKKQLLLGCLFGIALLAVGKVILVAKNGLRLQAPPPPAAAPAAAPATAPIAAPEQASMGCSEGYKLEDSYFPEHVNDPTIGNLEPLWDTDAAPPDISKVGAAGVMAWAQARLRQAMSNRNSSYHPSPEDWADSVIYNIVVDRFNNGDRTNDQENVHESQKEALNNNRYKAGMRHGGDLEGVRQRLPYLKDLGVNVLWLTPIFKHDGTYHGYCSQDPTRVDPGFGTNELLRKLVNEAHELGIRVILDVVINHLCDVATKYTEERGLADDAVVRCAEAHDRMHWAGEEGGPIERTDVVFSDHFFPPLKSVEFFNRCGPNSPESVGTENPIAVYGDFTYGMFDFDTRNRDFQRIFTKLIMYWVAYADIDGFRLDAAKHVSEDFLAYFSTKVRIWAETVNKRNFLIVGEVAGTVQWQARRVGAMSSDPVDPNRHNVDLGMPKTVTKMLVSLKEDYQSHGHFRMPGLDSIYNFYQSGKAKAAMQGVDDAGNNAYVGSLGAYLQDEGLELSSVMGQLDDCCAKHPEGCTGQLPRLWTLLEIHDWPRFASKFPSDLSFAKVGFVWLFTSPGQPIVYYGAEHGFNNMCPDEAHIDAGDGTPDVLAQCKELRRGLFEGGGVFDPFYRQDMFAAGPLQLGSVVPEVDKKKVIDIKKLLSPPEELFESDWTKDPALDRRHALYKHVRKLARLRSTCPTLVKGKTVWGLRGYDGRPPRALMVFSRVLSDMEIVVVINPNSNAAKYYQFECDPAINKEGAVYRDVLDADVFQTFKVQLREGRCFLNPEKYQDGNIEPYRTRILIDESRLQRNQSDVLYHNVLYHPEYDDIALCARPQADVGDVQAF